MYEMTYEIAVSNSTKTKDIQEIDKAIEKLKLQENKLVDLYLNSSLNKLVDLKPNIGVKIYI